MKIFSHDEFNQLLFRNDTIIKLPEQKDGFYFMVILNSNELETGIGNDNIPFQQNWELNGDIKLNNSLHFTFKMWGKLPDNLKIDKDVSKYEGKEIAVPANTIMGVLNNLAAQDPMRFNLQNLQKTQTIEKYIGLVKKD